LNGYSDILSTYCQRILFYAEIFGKHGISSTVGRQSAQRQLRQVVEKRQRVHKQSDKNIDIKRVTTRRNWRYADYALLLGQYFDEIVISWKHPILG
jgi:hypothetical protein